MTLVRVQDDSDPDELCQQFRDSLDFVFTQWGWRVFNWGSGVNRAPQNWGGGGAKGSIDGPLIKTRTRTELGPSLA